MAKRGIFVNVKPANDADDDLENQHKCFFDSENNLEFSPFRKRDGFTKASVKKVLWFPISFFFWCESIISILLLYVHRALQSSFNSNDIMQIIIFLQDIIFDCLKPIYNFLRGMGVFPQTRLNSAGEFQFYVKSKSMAYSFCIFTIWMVWNFLVVSRTYFSFEVHMKKLSLFQSLWRVCSAFVGCFENGSMFLACRMFFEIPAMDRLTHRLAMSYYLRVEINCTPRIPYILNCILKYPLIGWSWTLDRSQFVGLSGIPPTLPLPRPRVYPTYPVTEPHPT